MNLKKSSKNVAPNFYGYQNLITLVLRQFIWRHYLRLLKYERFSAPEQSQNFEFASNILAIVQNDTFCKRRRINT